MNAKDKKEIRELLFFAASSVWAYNYSLPGGLPAGFLTGLRLEKNATGVRVFLAHKGPQGYESRKIGTLRTAKKFASVFGDAENVWFGAFLKENLVILPRFSRRFVEVCWSVDGVERGRLAITASEFAKFPEGAGKPIRDGKWFKWIQGVDLVRTSSFLKQAV